MVERRACVTPFVSSALRSPLRELAAEDFYSALLHIHTSSTSCRLESSSTRASPNSFQRCAAAPTYLPLPSATWKITIMKTTTLFLLMAGALASEQDWCASCAEAALVPFQTQFSRFAAHAEAAVGCTWVLHASSMAAAALTYADEFASVEKAEEQAGEHDGQASGARIEAAAAAAVSKPRDIVTRFHSHLWRRTSCERSHERAVPALPSALPTPAFTSLVLLPQF